MISILKDYVIFLHGLSGSGKGVIKRVLTEIYNDRGYEVLYGSSGDLFRAALKDPEIAEQVNQGIFLETLGAILPGLQQLFERFLWSWKRTEGKTVLILDGFLRRGCFFDDSGQLVPSQLAQISGALYNALREIAREDPKWLAKVIQHENLSRPNVALSVINTLKGTIHIVTSILPVDAEKQMIARSKRQIELIYEQVTQKNKNDLLTSRQRQIVEDHLAKFEAILLGGINYVDDKLVWLPTKEWGYSLKPNQYPKAVEEVGNIRRSLAESLGLDRSSSLAEIFESLGVLTELRADDITDLGRKKRIENYIANYLTAQPWLEDGQSFYEPGFATFALTQDLCFSFNSNGTFVSEATNCFVVPNGQSRGIDLPTFETIVGVTAEEVVFCTRRL